jgi:hypothetical protein
LEVFRNSRNQDPALDRLDREELRAPDRRLFRPILHSILGDKNIEDGNGLFKQIKT